MKYRFLSAVGVLALASAIVLQAQDYDDIYYDGSSSSKVKTEKKSETVVTRNGNTTTVYTQQPVTKIKVQGNSYQTDRDVDEYNRRGISEYDPTDTLSYVDDDMAFSNTQKIERFYNPDIVVSSNDDELIELYYDDTPTVNLVIGSNYGYVPRVGWGIGYGRYWYDPWYSWYDPWYTTWYSPWYSWSWGWHRPYYYGWYSGYYGWYTGWHGWGVHRPYYGWNHHHNGWGHSSHHGWDRPGHHGNWGHNGMRSRVAGDSRSLLNGRTPSSSGGSLRNNNGARAQMQGINRGTTPRQGSMTGRARPNSGNQGQSMTGRPRTSTANVGNVGNRSVRPQGSSNLGRSSSNGIGRGSMRGSRSSGYSSGSSSSGYRGSSSSSSSRSYTPSYGSSRSSGSYSGGSSRGSMGGGGSSRGGGGGSSRGGGGGRH